MKKDFIKLIIIVIIIPVLVSSCGEDYTPKPYGYFRVKFPQHRYQLYDSTCPYTYEYPVYAKVVKDPEAGAHPCWQNIKYPQFKATLHLTYDHIDSFMELYKLSEDAYKLVTRHNVKAESFTSKLITDSTHDVYGIMYSLTGDVASYLQFFVTDSTQHYLRGSLYFKTVPNEDSLAPSVAFLKKDIVHMVNTLRWK